MGEVINRPELWKTRQVEAYASRMLELGVMDAILWGRVTYGIDREKEIRGPATALRLKNERSKK